VKRLLKKLLALLIIVTVTMMSAALLTYAVSEDAPKTADDRAFNLLVGLGVLSADKVGEKAVTRGEFTAMLMDLFYPDLSATVKVDDFYYDVEPANSLASKIALATQIGVVNSYGNGLFYPNRTVTQIEAIKMVVSLLGLRELAIARGDFPMGYSMVAAQQGITAGIKIVFEQAMDYYGISKLVLNALNSKAFEQSIKSEGITYQYLPDTTFMEKLLEITVIPGTVTAAGGLTLSRELNLKPGEIELDGNRYKYSKAFEAFDIVGEYVNAYVEMTERDEIIYIEKSARGEESLVVFDTDIVSSSKGLFSYISEDGVRSVTYPQDSAVIYNGRYFGSVFENKCTDEILNPTTGYFSLKDSDGNGTYDTVFIFSYESAIVESVERNNERINLKDEINGEKQLSVPESENKQIYITRNGKSAVLKDLAANDSILVAISDTDEQRCLFIDASNANVKGVVSEYSNESLILSEKEYYISPIFNFSSLKPGEAVTITLDAFGKAAFASYGQTDMVNYGYLRAMAIENALSEELRMSVFTTDAKFTTFTCTSKVNLNGESVKSKDLPMVLAVNQLIVYEEDENGKIRAIQEPTITNNPNCYDPNNFSIDYRGSGERFYQNMLAERFFVSDATGIFIIPTDKSQLDLYAYGNKNLLVKQEKVYGPMTFYDVDETRTAKIVMFEQGSADQEIIDENERCLIISKITTALDDEMTPRFLIKGFREGKEFSAFLFKDDVKDISIDKTYSDEAGLLAAKLRPGDVIQPSLSSKGEIVSFRLVFRNKAMPFYEACNGNVDPVKTHAKLYLSLARVTAVNSSMLAFNPNVNQNNYSLIRPVKLSGVGIYRYDSLLDTVYKAAADEISVGDTVFIRINWQVGHEILIID